MLSQVATNRTKRHCGIMTFCFLGIRTYLPPNPSYENIPAFVILRFKATSMFSVFMSDFANSALPAGLNPDADFQTSFEIFGYNETDLLADFDPNAEFRYTYNLDNLSERTTISIPKVQDPDEVISLANDRLSFGVEYEYLVGTLDRSQKDPFPKDPRKVFDWPDDDKYLSKGKAWIVPGADDAAAHERWVNAITERVISDSADGIDAHLVADGLPVGRDQWYTNAEPLQAIDMYHTWANIETRSPPYYFSANSLEDCKEAARTIKRNFRVSTREEGGCGGHVHVGNGDLGFDLATLQGVMAILWTFERQFDALHPSWRHVNSYCLPLFTHSLLGIHLAKTGSDRKKGLETIFKQTSRKEIVYLCSDVTKPRIKLRVNILALADPSFPQTIEFRQHEGTLDEDQIEHNVKTCVGIVEFASACPRVVLQRWLRKSVKRTAEDYGAVDVLMAMGLYEQAIFYGLRKAKEG